MTIGVGAHDKKDAAANQNNIASNGVTTSAASSTLFAFTGWYANQVAPTITDNKGNNAKYTQIQSTVQGAADSAFRGALFYAENIAGGSGHVVTATWPGNVDVPTIYLVEVTGGLTSGILDQNPAGVEDTSSPYTSNTTGTTSQAVELALAFVHTYTTTAGPETITWGNGFTVIDATTTLFTGGTAQKLLSSTGTVQSSITSAGAGATGAISWVVTLKDAGGGGGGGSVPKRRALLGVGARHEPLVERVPANDRRWERLRSAA